MLQIGENIATREAYGRALVSLGEQNPDVIVLDADLAKSTKTIKFKEKFPDRFFDMGIAEADMMGTAAGLADAIVVPANADGGVGLFVLDPRTETAR